MKLAVTIPIYMANWNHRDFVDQTTRSLTSSHPWLFIPVLNHLAPQFAPYAWKFVQHPRATYEIEGRQPQAVAKAWNDGIARAGELGCDYVLVLNDDLVLKANAIDRLVEFAEAHPEAVLWSMGSHGDLFTIQEAPEDENYSEHPHFAAFMVKPEILSTMGLFDENFIPGYLEDCDYHARIALANQKAYIYGGSKVFHFGSRTINADPDWKDAVSPTARNGAAYFQSKWGHGIVNEPDQMRQLYYAHPYNEPDKPLSYWRQP